MIVYGKVRESALDYSRFFETSAKTCIHLDGNAPTDINQHNSLVHSEVLR